MTGKNMTFMGLLLLILSVCSLKVVEARPGKRPVCIRTCEGRPDGDYHSCEGCNMYASCGGGVLHDRRPCPTGLVWDDDKRICNYKSRTCPGPPNIIYMIVDDAGYMDFGYQNPDGEKPLTPNLDGLALGGMILDNHYMMMTCTPSRHSLMTGRYAYNSQMQHFILTATMPHCSPTNLEFLPEVLRRHGYGTHMAGKWHLGFCKEACTPTGRGFDSFWGLYAGKGFPVNHTTSDPEPVHYDWHYNNIPSRNAIGEHATNLVTERAEYLIKHHTHRSKPMFLYLAHVAPHSPLQVPPKYVERLRHIKDENRRLVLAMLAQVDDGVKRIIDSLKEEGMYDNTLFVFSSDNGGDWITGQYNGPLRGMKGSLWEGGTKASAFVHGPMVGAPGTRHKGLFHVTDWFPTLLSIAQAEVPDSQNVDGLDQSNMILSGSPSVRENMIYNLDIEQPPFFGQAAIRMGDLKIIWGYPGEAEGHGRDSVKPWDYGPYLERLGIPEDEWYIPEPENEFVVPPEIDERRTAIIQMTSFRPDDITSGDVYLFNLADDPNEEVNLADEPAYARIVLGMKFEILNLLENGYVKPQPRYLDDWYSAALKVMRDDAWTMGFCNNVTIEV